MQVTPFENIRENIITKRVMPDKPIMISTEACNNSEVSALLAVFEIGAFDKEIRPYGYMINLMLMLLNTHDRKKDINWRFDPNITGSFESHFNIGAES